MFDRIHHVAYTVDDLDAYMEFFGEILEFEQVDYQETDRGYTCAVYRVGETYIEVQEPTDHPGMQAWLEAHGNGLNHVSYGVSDLEETITRLRENGIQPAAAAPGEAPSFPGRMIINMDEATSRGIYLQLTEEPPTTPS